MTEINNVRTRFAPSPTGSLHIGGARTALFNWLFTRKMGGAFVLRVDDTDDERSDRAFEDEILRDLRWLGIDWDEGPDVGGEFAPYRQSERGEIYRAWVEKLLSLNDGRKFGFAYHCNCSQERLETLRASQLAAGLPPKYDDKCRHEKIAPSEATVVRFALPRTATVHDILRGDYTLTDAGDFIIERSNGQAVYLFTSVIDDILMKITHVIRGDEHLPNAARQQAIFDTLGEGAPLFAHIPMILGADRHKLSKRTGSKPIYEYRERGFYPQAMCAYLATLSHKESGGHVFHNMDALVKEFSLDKITASAPVHDEEHLLHQQRLQMSAQSLSALRGELFAFDPVFVKIAMKKESAFNALLDDVRKEHPTVPDIARALAFLAVPPKKGGSPPPAWLEKIFALLADVKNEDWNAENINRVLREFQKSNGLAAREFFHTLRLVLTGHDRGSPLPLVLAVMGKGEFLHDRGS